MQPQILTLSALRDSSRYTLVPHVPMLDIHEHINDEKPEVDEDLLELIARNTNERIANLAIPAGNAGHTCEPGECSEDEQPETIGYVINWEVDEFNGRPCLYADVYYRNDKLKLAKKLPYRSVERYISDRPDRNFIDAVSFQKSAPERDLGVLEFYHRSMEPGDTIVRYGRDMPAIKFPSGGGVKVDGCGCDTKADEPKTSPKTKPKARKNKGQFKKGEPKAATTEAEPKGGKKNKGHFKVGNDHHKRRKDRKLNEGVQVNMEHLKETILGLLKQSKTGTIKARYSLDDPFATKTTSTAGPSAKVGSMVRDAFGGIGKVIGSPAMTGKPAPQSVAIPGGMQAVNPLAPTNVGPGRGTPPKVAPKPKDAPNATQAMPGQQPQQPAPAAQPAAPQQPAAHFGPLPAAASVTKQHDEAQRQAARGEKPTPVQAPQVAVQPRTATPVNPARVAGAKKQAAATSPNANPAIPKNAPIPLVNKSQGYPLAPGNVGGSTPGVGRPIPLAGGKPEAYDLAPDPTPASRHASKVVDVLVNKLGRDKRMAADAVAKFVKENPNAEINEVLRGAYKNIGTNPDKSPLNYRINDGTEEAGRGVADAIRKAMRPTVAANAKAEGPVGNNDPTAAFPVQPQAPAPKTVDISGQARPVSVTPKAPKGPQPIGTEPGQPGSQKMQGPPATFRERPRAAGKPTMPKPKLSPKPIGGKQGVFDRKPVAMPRPELPRNSKKVRIEAGDKITSKKGGTFSVIGHTPDNGSERFVHLKNNATGKTIQVPRARFHSALQRGEISLPDGTFAKADTKPVAKPKPTSAKKSAGGEPNWNFHPNPDGSNNYEKHGEWGGWRQKRDELIRSARADGRLELNESEKAELEKMVPPSFRPGGTTAKNPEAATVNPTKDPSQSPYRKLDAQDWTSDKADSPYDNLDTPRTKPFATIEDGSDANEIGNLPPRAEQYDDSDESYNETPPAPPMDRKQAREVAWKQQYNAARQFNGGKHLSPGQRKELENHFNRTFREAERQGLTKNLTPQPDEGSPFGSLPKHWHDPRLKLSPGNYYRDHWRSVLAGGMTGLSGRMTPWSFDQSINPPHLADPGSILPRSAKIYRTINSTVPRSGMVHQSSVSYATQALANEAHRRRQLGGNAPQAGIGSNATPRANTQQPAQPTQQRAEPHVQPQADPRVRPSKVVTPEEMAAAPPKIKNSGDPMFSQVVTSLSHQKRNMTADEYRRMDAHWPEIKDALGKLDEQRRASGQATTHKDTADDFARVMASLPQPQAPVTPQEPQQAAPDAQPAQQPSVHPVAAQQLQAAQAMVSGGKAGSAFAKDAVVQAAALAAKMDRRQPTAEDIDKIHDLWKGMFRETGKPPDYQALAHAYMHGQPDAPQAGGEPQAVEEPQGVQDTSQVDPQYKQLDRGHVEQLRLSGFPEYGIEALNRLAAQHEEGKGDPRIKDFLTATDSIRLPRKGEVKPSGVLDPRYKRLDRNYVDALIKAGVPDFAIGALNEMTASEQRGMLPENTRAILRAMGESGAQTPFNMPRVKPAARPAPKTQAEQVAKMRRTILSALRAARTA